MRPTRPSGHKPPTVPSPFMTTLLSDDIYDVEQSSGEPLVQHRARIGAASSSAHMPQSVGNVFHCDESPSRQHIEYAPSDAGSNNHVLAVRTKVRHAVTTDSRSDAASDYSDKDLWNAEPQQAQSTTSASPMYYFVALPHAAPNGSPIGRTRPIAIDNWWPGPLDSTRITTLKWRVERAMGTFDYSPVVIPVVGVLHPSGIQRNYLEAVHEASSHKFQNPALVGPPPKFILPKGRGELRRQTRQVPLPSQTATHSTPPLRTVQARRSKYVVPRILSRTGSFFDDDPFVTKATPTVEQALSWSYERVLMTTEEYEQKVAEMADDETNISTPLYGNDPFAALAQNTRRSKAIISPQSRGSYGSQDSLGESSRAAAKFTSAVSPGRTDASPTLIFAMSPLAQASQLELSGTHGSKLETIDEGVEESSRQPSQDQQVSPFSTITRRLSKPKKILAEAEVFATRRMSLKQQLAANGVKRKDIIQREEDEITTWQASAPFEGAQLAEELQKFTTAAKEQTELRLRILDGESRTIQNRLSRLGFIERSGKGPVHLHL
ncbi:hypothetical protein PSPO01_03255 [Paraphaeosphaeria sporulosa]